MPQITWSSIAATKKYETADYADYADLIQNIRFTREIKAILVFLIALDMCGEVGILTGVERK